eukprot:COSAG05_NODE_8683_length_681_cov_0.743986_2_plen_52_part_01
MGAVSGVVGCADGYAETRKGRNSVDGIHHLAGPAILCSDDDASRSRSLGSPS